MGCQSTRTHRHYQGDPDLQSRKGLVGRAVATGRTSDAARPQYDTFGGGVIIANHAELHEPAAKINVLLQAYISQLKLEGEYSLHSVRH